MIILESLRCDYCHEPCRYSICKENNGPRFCFLNWRLLCFECVKKDRLEEWSLGCPKQLLAAVLLTNLACPEEIKILDFGKWNPIACTYCHTPFEYNGNREIHCCATYSEGVVHCMEPACRAKCTHDICKNMEEMTYRLTNVMNELRPYFLGNEYVPIRNKTFDDPRMDPFKRLYYCSICGTDRNIADPFMCGTELVCHACLVETDIDWEDIVRYHKTEITLAHIFPDVDDLKLLTFEKWAPFRCVNCSDIFSDDSETHPLYLGTETLCVKCARDAANEFSHGTRSGVRTDFVVDLNKELKKYFNRADDDILPMLQMMGEERPSDVSDTPSSDAEEPVLDGDLHRQRRKLRGQTLLVESLRCDVCENPCQFSICKTSILPRFCIDSRKLVCSNCSREHGYESAGSALQSPSQLLAAILLNNLACPEEIKLLDFGKWNPIACEYCHIPFDFSGSREIHCCTSYPKCVVHCMQPMCMGKCPHSLCENEAGMTDRLTHIMNDLRPFFSDKEYLPVRKKSLDDPRIDSLNWVCYCSRCGTGGNSSEKLIWNGQLICRSCASNVEDIEDAPQYHKTEISLAQIFPDLDDLKQLTFEKWTPFRCTKCSAIFTTEWNTFPLYDKVNMETLCAKCGNDADAEPERFHRIAFIVDLNNKIKRFFKRGTEETLTRATCMLHVREDGLFDISSDAFDTSSSDAEEPDLDSDAHGKLHKRQGRGLLLESLRCDMCQQLPQYSICKENKLHQFCDYCWRLLCAACMKEGKCCDRLRCDPGFDNTLSKQLYAAILLASRACPDEVGLLDFGKWNPFICIYCHTPFEYDGNRGVHYCPDGLHCRDPKCISQHHKTYNTTRRACRTLPEPEKRIKRIMRELHDYFSREHYVPVKNKSFLDPRVANLNWVYGCSRCGEGSKTHGRCMFGGRLQCASCGDDLGQMQFHDGIIPIAHIFPDLDDLNVLTFEKWTPFRCDSCSVVFTEEKEKYPIYHALLCRKTLCARCTSLTDCCLSPELNNLRFRAPFMVELNKEIKKYFKGDENKEPITLSKHPSWLNCNNFFSLKAEDVLFNKETLLGNGAQALVFKGTYKGQDVAVKSFLKQTAGIQDEFLLELEQFVHLHHPNLLKLIGYVMDERWIVLEYCPHQSLAEYIHNPSSSKVLAWRTLIQWTSQIIEGMHYLHSSGVTHRDLKPDNILIADDWTLQIGDFARSRTGKLTNTAFVTGNIGTRGYMAPELISGHSYGKKVDIWSFGVILWELCTRQRPFFKVDGNFATENIRLGKLCLPELVALPVEVNNVIKTCLSFDAVKRPSFKELRYDLWVKASDAIERHGDKWAKLVETASEQAKNHRYQLETQNAQIRDKKTYPAQNTPESRSSVPTQAHEARSQDSNSHIRIVKKGQSTRHTALLESAVMAKGKQNYDDGPSSSHLQNEEEQDSGMMPWEWCSSHLQKEEEQDTGKMPWEWCSSHLQKEEEQDTGKMPWEW